VIGATTRDLEQLTTEQILVIYERAFGALEPVARGRIIATASANGWDRAWEDAWPLAA
jgi:hypothetical protein